MGPLTIRWYGLLFVGAFLLGRVILMRCFVNEGVPAAKADSLLLHALLGAVVGARLVHCLFYDPAYYLAHPLAIMRIWEGGLASHGGAVGLLVGLWAGNRSAVPRLPFLWLADRVAMPAALGGVMIRVANFLNSEIVGVPTRGAWGVVFETVDALPRHPVQLYEATGYLFVYFVLAALYRHRRRATPPGLLAGWFMLLVFSVRIAAEAFKLPQAAYEASQIFSVGQSLSVPFVLLGLALIAWSKPAPAASPNGAAHK